MKTKFKSDEIAHIWAHKSAPHGDAPSAMSFNGDAFLSYGTEIARHFTRKGQSYVVLNDTGFSVTTSRHQSLVRQAVRGMTVFHCTGHRGDSLRAVTGSDLFKYAVESAADSQKKAQKARQMKGSYEAYAAKWLQQAATINEFFGLRRKVDGTTIERLRKAGEASERKQAKAQAAREAKQRIEQQEAFDAWLRGEDGGYFSHTAFPVAFRVEKDELVSTLGARVPLREAQVAFRFVFRHREGWHRNGETCPVGNYQLDAINAQGIVAGCHRISWAEVERLAPILNS